MSSNLGTVENTTYDELQTGACATVSRRVSATEVEALAMVGGEIMRPRRAASSGPTDPASKCPRRSRPTRCSLPWTAGGSMFVVVIPMRLEQDLRAVRNPAIQLNIDATAMQQAGIGAGYIKNIIGDRIASFQRRTEETPRPPVNLVVRKSFNPNGLSSWFKSVVAIINQITLLTVVLTGAAVIREREHGTLEHLLVMPLSAFEIAMASSRPGPHFLGSSW